MDFHARKYEDDCHRGYAPMHHVVARCLLGGVGLYCAEGVVMKTYKCWQCGRQRDDSECWFCEEMLADALQDRMAIDETLGRSYDEEEDS